ncbi:MAG: retroviral-like aspartic protease family protein [Candidatus Omnitrophica bacterium]|nr:retroviral-like aspartic protease family protein [Candidatus Omnitrophota bacterium]
MKMDGLIKSETDTEIELDLGFGKTRIKKSKIKSIKRSDEKETEQIHKEWGLESQKREKEVKELKNKQKTANEQQRIKRKLQKDIRQIPEKAFVKYIQRKNSIGVEALLDGKVRAELLVDTGATSILLRQNIAKALGISALHGKIVNMQVANGQVVKAVRVYLKSVSVDGMEVRDVEASVLLNDEGLSSWDGLLGMSYLKNFVFRIDAEKQELILEQKIKQ